MSEDPEEFARQIQVTVDQALADLPKKRKNARPRVHFMNAYMASHDEYGELYKKLAE